MSFPCRKVNNSCTKKCRRRIKKEEKRKEREEEEREGAGSGELRRGEKRKKSRGKYIFFS